MVVAVLEIETSILAQTGHIQHATNLGPVHIVLKLAATNGVNIIEHLSYHPGHPSSSTIATYSSDYGISTVNAPASQETMSIISFGDLAHYTKIGHSGIWLMPIAWSSSWNLKTPASYLDSAPL